VESRADEERKAMQEAKCPNLITVNDLYLWPATNVAASQSLKEWELRLIERYEPEVSRSKARSMIRVLIRPDNCSECGTRKRKIQGHHVDYHYPYQVEWLCTQCHQKRPKLPKGYKWSEVDLDIWRNERMRRRAL
jgi:hypothetical protein